MIARHLKLVSLFARLSVQEAVAYRVDFLTHLFTSLAAFASELMGLWIIFSNTRSLAGWNPWQSWHAWLFLALLMGGYLYHDIVTGQVSAIPIFATTIGFVCWRRGRVMAGAAALAVGIAFKILPGACVVFFLIKRQWRMVALTGMFTAAFAILPGLALFGPSELRSGWGQYIKHVAKPKSRPVEHPDRIRWTKPASFLNPALGVTLLRWFSDYPRDRHAPFLPVLHLPQQHVFKFYQGLMLAMGAVTLWCCRRRPEDEPPEATATQYGLLLVWMVLLSPHLAIYYMAWALWPVAVIMGHVARRDRLERRHDLFNEAILGLWGAVFVIQPESTLRAIGIHPAMLLVLWLALLVNILRANRNTNLWPAR